MNDQPETIGDLIRKMMNLTDRVSKESRLKELSDTKKAYEDIRKENFKKFPALKEAWEQYRMVEQLYTGKE